MLLPLRSRWTIVQAARFFERAGDLFGDLQHTGDAQPLARREVVQRLTGDVLHRQEREAIGLADFIDGADVRVTEGTKDPPFEQQPLAAAGVGVGVSGEDLERHVPLLGQVLGEVDISHAAMAEQLLDHVAGDGRSRGERQRVRRHHRSVRQGAPDHATILGACNDEVKR